MNRPTPEKPSGGRFALTAAICVVFVAGMVGMSFAAVPLYRVFCQVTGYGGTTQQAEAAPSRTFDREITVRFDGNVANGLGWSFRPRERQVRLRVGEVGEVAFIAENRTDWDTTGTATFNVTPNAAGAYFNKLACFCFSEQSLAGGQSRNMPVQFFIDPAIAEDGDLDHVHTITLSYTMYPGAKSQAEPVTAAQSERVGSSF